MWTVAQNATRREVTIQRNFLPLLILPIIFSTISCGNTNGVQGTQVNSSEAEKLHEPPSGIPAPNFSVKTVEGETRSLADYAGRPLLVIFWATWCGNCMRELPALSYMRGQIDPQKFSMMAINLGEHPSTVKNFLSKVQLPYEVGIDPQQKTADQFGVRAIPMMVLINPSGRIVNIDYALSTRMVNSIKEMTS